MITTFPAKAIHSACTAAAIFLVSTSTCSNPSIAATGYDDFRLKGCNPVSNCVSSNYNEPPNRYVSPLQIMSGRDEAFRRAVRDIQREVSMPSSSSRPSGDNGISIVEMNAKEYYIHLTIPGTTPGSVDDIELLFIGDNSATATTGAGIVNLRCESRITIPPPPFCLQKNCINGNMDQRRRIEKVTRVLGLPPSDQWQMQKSAKWTPIFFNSDRVPDTFEYDDFE